MGSRPLAVRRSAPRHVQRRPRPARLAPRQPPGAHCVAQTGALLAEPSGLLLQARATAGERSAVGCAGAPREPGRRGQPAPCGVRAPSAACRKLPQVGWLMARRQSAAGLADRLRCCLDLPGGCSRNRVLLGWGRTSRGLASRVPGSHRLAWQGADVPTGAADR